MKAPFAVLSLLGLGVVPSVGEPVTPVGKVIKLLEDLKARVVSEGAAEATTYDQFACYCKATTKTKSDAIISGRDNIQSLSAEIQEKTATKGAKSSELKERQGDHESLSKELADSVAECAKEKARYEEKSADLDKAISSLDSAIKAMDASKPASPPAFLAIRESVEQGIALASALNLIAEPKRQEVSALLQARASVDPNDPVFKYHSQGIIDTLTKLLQEFRDEKQALDTEWGKTKKSCTDTQKGLSDKIDLNNEAMTSLQTDIETLTGKIASAREDLVRSEGTLKDDQLYMKDLTSLCENRAKDWDQRSQMRADEIAALSGALTVLQDEVSGKDTQVNKRALFLDNSQHPVMAQYSQASIAQHSHVSPALLQEVSVISQAKSAKASAFLQGESVRLHSSVLASVAAHVEGDPFLKVKTLIQKLIERLLSESTAEATKKGFCDEQLGKAEKDREYRLADTQKLNAELKSLEVKEDELEAEIQMLIGDLKKLRDNLKEATDNRELERADNAKTIKTAKEGLAAVQEAITILKVFYKRAAKATVLALMQASPVDEDTSGAGFAGAYTASQTSSKNIIGLLQVIESDFDRTARVTAAAEKKAQEEFIEFDRASKADISGKDTKKTLDEEDLTTTKNTIERKMEDLQTAQDLVDSALKVLEALKPTCIDTGMSYEDRVAKREEEIVALKKAVCILLPEDADKTECL